MDDRIALEIIDGIADVRMTRADKLNALDDRMFAALIAAAEHVKATKGVRAVVLSGVGNAFCAGLDMSRMEAMTREGESQANRRSLSVRAHGPANMPQWAAYAWRECPAPVIAALHGVVFGGGFQIALGADIRLAAPETRFSVMEIKWGLVPDMAGCVLMRGLARDDIVRELTYTGRIFTGDEAAQYGFVTRLCADPRAEALALARDIAGKSPHAVRAAKRLLNLAAEADAPTILAAESQEQCALIGRSNQIEAARAQKEKRRPRFIDP